MYICKYEYIYTHTHLRTMKATEAAPHQFLCEAPEPCEIRFGNGQDHLGRRSGLGFILLLIEKDARSSV